MTKTIKIGDAQTYELNSDHSNPIEASARARIIYNPEPIRTTLKASAHNQNGKTVTADVFVDGEKIGTTPGKWRVSICSNQVFISSKEGFTRQSLELSDGKTHELETSIVPPNWIDVSKTCGVTENGSLECWGSSTNTFGPKGWGPKKGVPGDFTEVSQGKNNLCALNESGDVTCWFPDIGSDRSLIGKMAKPLKGIGTFKQITMGAEFICGLTEDGAVKCAKNSRWAGETEIADRSSKVFKQIDAGGNRVCGVDDKKRISCWGNEDYGGPTTKKGPYIRVYAFGDSICGMTPKNKINCWKDSDTSSDQSEMIETNLPDDSYTDISLSASHACGIRAKSRKIVCRSSQSGNDHYGLSNPPEGSFQKIRSGGFHACALKTDGAIKCWGGKNPNSSAVAVPKFK